MEGQRRLGLFKQQKDTYFSVKSKGIAAKRLSDSLNALPDEFKLQVIITIPKSN